MDGTIVKPVRGARVAFESYRRARVTSLQVWVRVGASFEAVERERGAAHFLEHMLFQSRPERFGGRGLGAVVEDGGGSVNAWTSQDYTVVHATFPTASFEEVAAGLLHATMAPDLSGAVVERERRVILQEISREAENHGLTCMRTLFEERYAGHPYARRVLGTADSVGAMTVEDLRSFHDRYYRPGRLAIAVVGDLEETRVLSFLDGELARFDRAPEPGPDVKIARPGRPGLRRMGRDCTETYFAIGFPIPHLQHRDVPALDCLSGILGETNGSVLEAWRRSSGLVNEVSTVSYTPVRGGVFALQGATNPAKTEAALEGLREAVAEFLARGPGQREMAAVQEEMSASALRIDETAQGRAGRVGYELAATGRAGFFREYMAKVLALRPVDVADVARKYLKPARASTVIVGPEDVVAKAPARFLLRIPEAAGGSPVPQRVVLPSGAVLLHWRDRTHGTVAVRVQAPGGLERETEATNGLHGLLARLFACGAGGRPGTSILRDFDALGAQFGASAGHSWVSSTLDVPAGRVGPGVALMARCLTDPNLAQGDVDRERDLLEEEVRTRVDRPGALVSVELARRLFRGHPYALDPAGRKEALDALTPDGLRRAVAGLWDPGALVIGVVGDADALEIAGTLVAAAGALEPGRVGAESPSMAGDARPAAGDGEVIRLTAPARQSHVGLLWPGESASSDRRLEVAVVGATLSMMSGPLFRVLRDELAIAYSFGAGSTSLRLGGWMKVAAAVKVGAEDQALEAIRDVLKRLCDGGADSQVLLRRGALHLAGMEDLAFQKKGAVAHWMCSNDGTPLGYDSFLSVADRIRAIEPGAAIEAARQVFCRDPVAVVLRPA